MVLVMSNEKTWIEYRKRVDTGLSLDQLSLNINKSVFNTFGSTDKSIPDDIEIKISKNKRKEEIAINMKVYIFMIT